MVHSSLVEKEKLHAKYRVSFHLRSSRADSGWASATRGTVDLRPGRLRQWGPLPHAPRPCANPVRASAPSRRKATAAPAYRPCYLRNYHSFNNWSYPHLLMLGAQRRNAERDAGSELVRARQSPAQARLLAPARGGSRCPQPAARCPAASRHPASGERGGAKKYITTTTAFPDGKLAPKRRRGFAGFFFAD
jgi:hypothetical protein